MRQIPSRFLLAPRFSQFDGNPSCFSSNRRPHYRLPDDVISLIFHWFFNEMGLGRSRSEILLISMILLMLFHRNEVPAADSPNWAISICFHIEISQNRWQAVHHRILHFRYVFISKFRLRRFSAIPQGTSFLEPTIRPPDGSDFDDLITGFHRNEANPEPVFVGPSI